MFIDDKKRLFIIHYYPIMDKEKVVVMQSTQSAQFSLSFVFFLCNADILCRLKSKFRSVL
jgi:hypothetical protein